MRVLIVSHGHPSFSIGGAEVASYNLFLGLAAQPGCESHYLARIGPPVVPHRGTALMSLRQKDNEMLFFANDYDHFRLSNRSLPALEQDFLRYVDDVAPDVVHFHHFIGLGLETILAVRRAFPRILIVVTLHEYLSICHHHGQMVKTGRHTLCYGASPAECAMCFPGITSAAFMKRELFIKSFFGLVDHFVSPSTFLIDRYVAWGLPRERFSMLENGLAVAAVAPPRPLPGGTGDDGTPTGRRGRFAFFGQITEFKGVRVLLDAIGRVPDDVWGDDASVAFFGGNLENQPEAFRDDFTRLMRRAGRRARFYGSYRAAEMPGLMRDVDWVVVPSIWWENSPLVIQEAFAHGRPVICSNIGGMAEKVRDRIDGLHYRAGSVEDLVDRLTEAMTAPGLWEDLRAGIRTPDDHETVAARHVDLYRTLIAARTAQTPARAVGG